MDELRVTLEIGPKGKKVVAVAPDWPGLERGGPTREAAVDALARYRARYAPVATLAGMADAFEGTGEVAVIEEYPGMGSTDYWGISFACSSVDHQPMTSAELARELALLRSCWTYFDDVRARVSSRMRKGPRGGGRDRDHIVLHTLATEQDWAKKLGRPGPKDQIVRDEAGVRAFRDEYCAAIVAYHAEGKLARAWPLRFLIRHTAFHVLDHTWEMEDKDLTGDLED